jgi:hypothetical protein
MTTLYATYYLIIDPPRPVQPCFLGVFDKKIKYNDKQTIHLPILNPRNIKPDQDGNIFIGFSSDYMIHKYLSSKNLQVEETKENPSFNTLINPHDYLEFNKFYTPIPQYSDIDAWMRMWILTPQEVKYLSETMQKLKTNLTDKTNIYHFLSTSKSLVIFQMNVGGYNQLEDHFCFYNAFNSEKSSSVKNLKSVASYIESSSWFSLFSFW